MISEALPIAHYQCEVWFSLSEAKALKAYNI